MTKGLGALPRAPMEQNLPQGLIASPIPGRTDRLEVSAKPNSYIIPADVVSGLGQGNTLAGARILDALLKEGPYGTALAKPMKPRTPKRRKGLGFADGGMPQEDVPIIVAGGEFAVPPEIVAALGNGDPEKGHKLLDQMVMSIRKQVIDQMKRLPGPER